MGKNKPQDKEIPFVDERQTELKNLGHPAAATNHRFRASHREDPFPNDRGEGTDDGTVVTKQSFKDEADINNVMKRFEQTGQLPDMIKREPKYGDFIDVPSFQEAQEIIIHTQEQFAALPAAVRDRFANDPEKFLEFVSDASNADEMARMGLMTPESVKRVQDARDAAKEKEIEERIAKKQKPTETP